jgi:hypothetical protein
MPLSNETIQNRPLSGSELLEIIVKDLMDLLSKDGMFATHVGYGRVGYKLSLDLEMDNLTYPTHSAQRSGGEGLPLLNPSPEALALSRQRARRIESPNAARVLNDIPIKVTSVIGGKLETHEVLGYDKDSVPPQPEPLDLDWSEAATKALRAKVTKGAK